MAPPRRTRADRGPSAPCGDGRRQAERGEPSQAGRARRPRRGDAADLGRSPDLQPAPRERLGRDRQAGGPTSSPNPSCAAATTRTTAWARGVERLMSAIVKVQVTRDGETAIERGAAPGRQRGDAAPRRFVRVRDPGATAADHRPLDGVRPAPARGDLRAQLQVRADALRDGPEAGQPALARRRSGCRSISSAA